MKLPAKVKNETGARFGKLTALEFVCLRGGGTRKAIWLCSCDCGKSIEVAGTDLRSGNTKSCGCLKVENGAQQNLRHGGAAGKALTGAYRSWRSMLARCNSPSNNRYREYGARGIAVSEAWRDFATFLADMGERPDGMSLERDDPNGNYTPANCRWLPIAQQARNTRKTVWVRLNGSHMSLAEAAEKMGVDRRVAWHWLKKSTVPAHYDLRLA